MLKRILAIAAITAFFACSSSSDDDDPPSSSSGNGNSSSDGAATGISSSSGGSQEESSSSVENWVLLYDFSDPLPENIIGYVFGQVTVGNDSLDVLDEDEEPTGEKYVVWNPDGILTLKNLSYNGSSTTSGENGGGLIIKELPVKDYTAFRFQIRGTAQFVQFRIKVEEGDESGAWGKPIQNLSETSFKTETIYIASANQLYNNTSLTKDQALEISDAIEFFPTNDGTVEIADFEVLEK